MERRSRRIFSKHSAICWSLMLGLNFTSAMCLMVRMCERRRLFAGQRRFDGLGDLLGIRRHLRLKAFEDFSIAADEELAKIPLDLAREWGVFAGQCGVKGA